MAGRIAYYFSFSLISAFILWIGIVAFVLGLKRFNVKIIFSFWRLFIFIFLITFIYDFLYGTENNLNLFSCLVLIIGILFWIISIPIGRVFHRGNNSKNGEGLVEKGNISIFPYAGFWKRFFAFCIDCLFLAGVGYYFGFIWGFLFGADEATISLLIIFSIFPTWLYFAFMESSLRQATIGKITIGIIVTDLEGNRVSFWYATLRHFGKIISGMIWGIGFIMIAFTEKKQGLHDKMAKCLVILKNNETWVKV